MSINAERELLESLKKISESKALNGGFDRLCVMVEHIQDKQDESSRKLDKVSDALYGPDTGLFSRVKMIESKLDATLGDLETKAKEIPTVKVEVIDLKKFQSSIEKIAGAQLEELNDLVRLKRHLSKIYWTSAASVCAFLGTILFHLVSRR